MPRFAPLDITPKNKLNFVTIMDSVLTKYRSFWICLALTLTTAAVFYQVYTYDFVNLDDGKYVYENPNIQSGVTLKAIKWAFTTAYATNWHPLTWLSHMLDWQLFGSEPAGHHLINLIFHIANTLLLFIVLKQMTHALWPSAFVAALFALHPLHVESVAWASERKDVLSTFFWMLTMWAYVRFVSRPKIARYLLVVVFFALGLMAKPMLVTLPFVLLLLDYWPLARVPYRKALGKIDKSKRKHADMHFRRRILYRLIWEKIPFFILSVLSAIVTLLAQRSGGAIAPLTGLAIKFRISNALISYVIYIGKMIWPSRLAVFYPHPFQNVSISYAVISAVFLLAVTILILRFAANHRYLVTGWFWYLGTLVPVIGLVQVGIQARADRYTYLPSIGIFIMVAWGAAELFTSLHRRKFVLGASAGIILAALMLCTRIQVRYWQDSLTLCGRALKVTKDNYTMHNNYAKALHDKGRSNEAILHLEKALRINPRYVIAYVNLGTVYLHTGKIKQAVDSWNKALRLKPHDIDALNNLAWLKATQENPDFRNPDEAVQLALRACEQAEYNQPDILDTLAVAYAAAGSFSKAIEITEKALELCRSSEQETFKDVFKERLALYKAGKPYIEK